MIEENILKRRKLQQDIETFGSVELPLMSLSCDVFPDLDMLTWANALGFLVEFNPSPEKEFKCYTTVILTRTTIR